MKINKDTILKKLVSMFVKSVELGWNIWYSIQQKIATYFFYLNVMCDDGHPRPVCYRYLH